MRLLGVLVATCALSCPGIAQALDCRSIADSGSRLACYDKAAPPVADQSVAAKTSAARKFAPPAADGGPYVDTISAEDALMNARLKNICRGC